MELHIEHREPIFPIRTAAKLLNISIATLRLYEKEGLIIPAKTEGNQRMYSQADIERIECIRKAIRDSKLSINGIKSIYSMIPCWDIVNCPIEDRENCSAYLGHEEPCWIDRHPNTVCEFKECRECRVYQNFYKCGDIKNLIRNISGKKS